MEINKADNCIALVFKNWHVENLYGHQYAAIEPKIGVSASL